MVAKHGEVRRVIAAKAARCVRTENGPCGNGKRNRPGRADFQEFSPIEHQPVPTSGLAPATPSRRTTVNCSITGRLGCCKALSGLGGSGSRKKGDFCPQFPIFSVSVGQELRFPRREGKIVMRPSIRHRSPALARLCQCELLGADEERRLFRQMKRAREQVTRSSRRGLSSARANRGPAARLTAIRNRIALSNLRLVVSIAKRFASPQQSLEDLVSEASLLLLRCVERFDAGRGTRFSTYATRALTHHFVRLSKRERRRGLRSLSQALLDRMPPQ